LQPQPDQLRRISKNECLALITEPLARDFGYRHLWIGYTGCGKTVANLDLIEASADAHRTTLITDQKTKRDRPSVYAKALGYSEIPSLAAFDAVPEDSLHHKQAIVRGFGLTGDPSDILDFDAIGAWIWQKAHEGDGALLGIDELGDACQGERTWVKGGDPKRAWMRVLYTQGRENKVSIAACVQNVQEIPRSAISNSDTIGIFVQDRKELPYYAANNFLDSRELDIVANLQDYEFLFMKRGMVSCICQF
jgi:hypothetical protein